MVNQIKEEIDYLELDVSYYSQEKRKFFTCDKCGTRVPIFHEYEDVECPVCSFRVESSLHRYGDY